MKICRVPCLLALVCAAAAACGDNPAYGDSSETSGSAGASDPGGPSAAGESGGSSGPSATTGSTSAGAPTSTSADADTVAVAETGASTSTSTDASTGTSTGATTDAPPPDMGPDPNLDIPPLDAEGCPGIYAQDLLPTFELTITPAVWQALQSEWANGQFNEDMGIEPNPYHPLAEFRYGDIVITDAEIRLRGNPTWWTPEDKLQFQIGFEQNDDHGRFLGLRRLAFDAATFNRHMLRDRLALAVLRDMGILAPCANSARLDINGEYYGLFTSIEKLDESFLKRVFADPTGDLWERANWDLKTNKGTATTTRLNALKGAASVEELEAHLDLEQALAVFAAEAILPDSDGMWAGGLNFYLYDEPIGGRFVLLPWDLDNTFERFEDPPDGEYPINPDPVVWEKMTTNGRPFYDLALTDPEWFEFYVASIEQQLAAAYQPAVLHQRIDEWTAQIQESVLADTNKPYSNQLYLLKVAALHTYVQGRHDFLTNWLLCWQNGGTPDVEGYCVP